MKESWIINSEGSFGAAYMRNLIVVYAVSFALINKMSIVEVVPRFFALNNIGY